MLELLVKSLPYLGGIARLGKLLTKRASLFTHLKYLTLRGLWGFNDRDTVTVICSELPNGEKRQQVEPREPIYLMKYGDLDAYFEVMLTLNRIFPSVVFRLMSAQEALNSEDALKNSHLVVIGGPDYNLLASDLIIKRGLTMIEYKATGSSNAMPEYPEEIAIHHKKSNKSYWETDKDNTRDYGYIERIVSPYNRNKSVTLIGGCHTVGVTGAAKFLSAFSGGSSQLSMNTVKNIDSVWSSVKKMNRFSVVIPVSKSGFNYFDIDLPSCDLYQTDSVTAIKFD